MKRMFKADIKDVVKEEVKSLGSDVGGVVQPAPAPRFGRTACAAPTPPAPAGADTDAVLTEMGLSQLEIAALRERGAAG